MNKQNFSDAMDIFSSCFVFASAGSGKTKILVDRFVKSLFFGTKPHEILCLTFTNAAVFEMQDRIAQILQNLYLNKNEYTKSYCINIFQIKNPTEKDIKKAGNLFFDFQDNLQNLNILTIHAFCQNLLRKFPMEAGINPNFDIIDETTSRNILAIAKQNIFQALPENFLNEISKIISNHSFEEFINKIYSDSSRFNKFFSENPDIGAYQTKLERMFALQSQKDFSPEQTATIKKHCEHSEYQEIFLTKTGAIRKKLPNIKDANDLAEIVYENMANRKKENVIKKTIGFLSVAKKIFAEHAKLKTDTNYLDFSDVLNLSEFLLTKSYAKNFVLSKLANQIKSIMIDEAQDLSATQWKLIDIFSEEIFTDPTSQKTIFIVGDIKQSIYRFQGANHKLFLEFYQNCKICMNKINKPFKTIYLNISYRTLPSILNAVDMVFHGNVGKTAFEQEGLYQPHVPYRKNQNGKMAFIAKQDICHTIRSIQQAQTTQSCNILILTRSRNKLSDEIKIALIENNIKIAQSDRINLSSEMIVMDILAIIDICLDINNEYSLCCIAKSPFLFGCPLSNDDLFSVRDRGSKNIFENIKTRLPNVGEKISYIINNYNKCTIVEFLYYLSLKILKFSNQNEKDIVNTLISEAINFFQETKNTNTAFLEHIRSSDIKITQQNQQQKGVRISTIHSSKGLEADIVFLLDFSLNVDKAKIKFIWQENATNSLFFIKPSSSDSFNQADDMIQKEYDEENKEILRLLYVAMTRARDCLFVVEDSGENIAKKNNSMYDFVSSAVGHEPQEYQDTSKNSQSC